jgi:hypothetical protein
MTDPNYEAAQKLFEQPKPAPVMGEYELEQQRILANLQRLPDGAEQRPTRIPRS